MKVIRDIYIYKNINLPKLGWIQGCFICYAQTAHMIDDDYIKKQITTKLHIYLCPLCQNIIQNYDEIYKEYKLYLNMYIQQKIAPYL